MEVLEAPGVEPVFPEKRQAIDYAQPARIFAPVRFAFSTRLAGSNAPFRSTRRIECCDRAYRFWPNVSFELPGMVEPIRQMLATSPLFASKVPRQFFGNLVPSLP
jgi:hypothetical protein